MSSQRSASDPVTIGEVVERINDRRADPKSDGFERFVGVDDLDSDDLVLRRWGNVQDDSLPPTFRFAFPANSVLFPTRRPALRKCAVAHFAGVTGEKVLALRPKDPRRLDPSYMAYLLGSEGVRKWVVERAIGSVTPHFRWRDLAAFSFVLPAPEAQRKLALLLQRADAVVEASRHLHRQTLALLESLNQDVFRSHRRSHTLLDFCDVDPEQLSTRELSSPETCDYIDLSSVEFPGRIGRLQQIRLDNAPSRARRRARRGDVLVATVRPNLRGHAQLLPPLDKAIASTGFAILRPRDVRLQPIVFGMILSSLFRAFCESRITGTAYPSIRSADVGQFRVPNLLELLASSHDEKYGMVTSAIELTLQRLENAKTDVTSALRRKALPN